LKTENDAKNIIKYKVLSALESSNKCKVFLTLLEQISVKHSLIFFQKTKLMDFTLLVLIIVLARSWVFMMLPVSTVATKV
jgi:hypothetical protein